jgi:4a-hydroxytetrahydrobiopterin dehydratase
VGAFSGHSGLLKSAAPARAATHRIIYSTDGGVHRVIGMSEDGWRAFLSGDGVDDWVILHGGPTAVFTVSSLQDATHLAAAVSQVPGLGPRTLLTATSDRLTVKLTREMWGTERGHLDVARAISALAREHGAVADRAAVQEVQVAIAAKPEAIDLPFWRAVLGYAPLHEDNCIDPLGQGSTVWMQDLEPSKALRHAMHIDVSLSREHIQARLAEAVAAGGRVVDDSEAPSAWILADQSGNKVCLAAWPDGARPAPEDDTATTSGA